jgi:hypothetical protein
MGEVKMAEVVDIMKNRIKLTNADVVMLTQQVNTNDGRMVASPAKNAFDKLQAALVTSGKPYYWAYRTWKKIISMAKEFEEDRIALAKEFCDKDDTGEVIFADAQYQFEPTDKKSYDEAVAAANSHDIKPTEAELEALAEIYCKKDGKGKSIKTGGWQLKFSGEGITNFNNAYMAMLNEENVLDNDKITIDSALLEKINEKLEISGKEIISLNDMVMVEKIFDFVE